MALNALANTANMPEDHCNVLKTIALIAILEPVPGLQANTRMIAWSLGITKSRIQSILDDLAERNVDLSSAASRGLWLVVQAQASICHAGWMKQGESSLARAD